jgi:hypothetical protein
MAKPINLYQGPAPERVMAQMGAGISEAGARIGQTLQRGYESMGQGIAGGINAVAGAYKEYKDDQAKFDATKKLFKAFSGSLSEDERKNIQGIFDDTSISTREKNAISPAVMQYIGAANKQQQDLARLQKEIDARAGLQTAGDVAARDRAVLGAQSQFDLEQLRQKYRAQQGTGVNFGIDPISGGAGNNSSYYNSLFGE